MDAVNSILMGRCNLKINKNSYKARGFDLRRKKRVKTYIKSERSKVCHSQTAHGNIDSKAASSKKRQTDTKAGITNYEAASRDVA